MLILPLLLPRAIMSPGTTGSPAEPTARDSSGSPWTTQSFVWCCSVKTSKICSRSSHTTSSLLECRSAQYLKFLSIGFKAATLWFEKVEKVQAGIICIRKIQLAVSVFFWTILIFSERAILKEESNVIIKIPESNWTITVICPSNRWLIRGVCWMTTSGSTSGSV